MALDVVRPQASKKTNGGGSRIELREFVLFNSLPVSGRAGIDRGRFKDGGGDAVGQRPVDDVTEFVGKSAENVLDAETWDLRVSRDPTNICHASKLIIGMHIEHIFNGQSRTKKVASGGMYDSFGFTCRARSLYTNNY